MGRGKRDEKEMVVMDGLGQTQPAKLNATKKKALRGWDAKLGRLVGAGA